MNTSKPSLFTIPAGVSFADSFAAVLLQQNQDCLEKLPQTLILLPTRRACRVVREAFLRQSGGVALMLPRMQTIGDVDEESLSLETAALGQAGAVRIPPSLSPMRRRIILMQLIMKRPDYAQNPDRALALADALALLIDRIHTEGLDMAALPGLVDGEFAAHWQITLDFLTIISQGWPQILAAHGCIDSAERRNFLLQAIAAHWEKHPPAYPVIAAGSTGSIPATANLLKVIAALPQGKIVLPGLDQGMDEASWRALDDTHPQATLKTLLEVLQTDRQDVRLWNQPPPPGGAGEERRTKLAREMMRPAATTELWRSLSKNAAEIAAALNGLQRIDCATAQEEARVISLIFRHVQHSKNRSAALVTSDRNLARRVSAACARWGLRIDDTAGVPLVTSPIGSYLSLCAESCAASMDPISLLALLKHRHAAAGPDNPGFRGMIRQLDLALRGPPPGPGLEGLRQHIAAEHAHLAPLLDRVELCFAPLLALADGEYHPFAVLLDAHLAAAEAFAESPQQSGAERLWSGEDGEAAALFLSDLRDHAESLPAICFDHYLPMLQMMMRSLSIRPAYGAHPRLMILGPLEARMLQADLVILGGLNEGSWPSAPEADPWMSRPMRKSFGLPAPEKSIGLSAHDFVQGFCAAEVILTRSERSGTAPTIPSRWLQRLDTVLDAAGLKMPRTDWLERARMLDHTGEPIRISRPAPTPPAEKRPVRLSVTEIETWMRDPYALYAKRILGLKKLDPAEQQENAAERGTILHETIEKFIKKHPHTLSEAAYDDLLYMGHTALQEQVRDLKTRHFWTIRFDQAAKWFFEQETTWRNDAEPVATEIKGELTLPDVNFTLTGKADRIDRMKDGSGLAIIDYKTGEHPPEKQVIAGLSPQLSLEAAMAREGAFPDLTPAAPAYLGYWKLGGGKGGGKATSLKATAPDILADQALLGLRNLVRRFANDDTPYFSLPRPNCRPKFQDYAHLARVQEWAVLDDTNGEGE